MGPNAGNAGSPLPRSRLFVCLMTSSFSNKNERIQIQMDFRVNQLTIFSVIPLQQIKALLESVGSSFCPDYSDWFGTGAADSHSRNADRSVLSKFLQAHPADYSTKKLQVSTFLNHIVAHGNLLIMPNSTRCCSCVILYILASSKLQNYLVNFFLSNELFYSKRND